MAKSISYRSILAALAASAVLAIDMHTAKTTHGLITGHSAPNVSDVVEFLGIPYAEPPVGALRFKPPQPHSRKHSFHAAIWVRATYKNQPNKPN